MPHDILFFVKETLLMELKTNMMKQLHNYTRMKICATL